MSEVSLRYRCLRPVEQLGNTLACLGKLRPSLDKVSHEVGSFLSAVSPLGKPGFRQPIFDLIRQSADRMPARCGDEFSGCEPDRTGIGVWFSAS